MTFTAADARAAMLEAQSISGTYLRKETDDLLAKIAEAAKKGQKGITTGMIDDIVQKRLRSFGYSLEWTNGCDQRDPGYFTIGW